MKTISKFLLLLWAVVCTHGMEAEFSSKKITTVPTSAGVDDFLSSRPALTKILYTNNVGLYQIKNSKHLLYSFDYGVGTEDNTYFRYTSSQGFAQQTIVEECFQLTVQKKSVASLVRELSSCVFAPEKFDDYCEKLSVLYIHHKESSSDIYLIGAKVNELEVVTSVLSE